MAYFKTAVITVIAIVVWAALVVLTSLNGWWYKPIARDDEPASFVAAINRVVEERNVGNIAWALLEEAEVTAEGYGTISQTIDRDTVFPTASVSKFVTALGVMIMVERGDLDLDVPIATYLTRWQLTPSEYSNDDVTIRRLLSHTAGLIDGLGFGDYMPSEQIPDLEESLSNPRASSGQSVTIKLGRAPGEEYDYSGGGYLILQLILEEVSGQTFEDYMQGALLQPLGMSQSTFAYIGEIENKTISYDTQGKPAPHYRYAASAATGFSSSVADLTKLVQALLGANSLLTDRLSIETIASIRAPAAKIFGVDAWGLGAILYAPTESGDYVYGHDGQNDPAINAAVRINPETRDAIIVLATGNPSLATYLGFEWSFWQTGTPDILGIGYLQAQGVRVFSYGLLVILALALFSVRRDRRRSR